MKVRILAFILAVTVLSWSQTTTPAPSSAQPAQSSSAEETPKADCSGCCKHMSSDKDAKDAKDAKGCCHHMHHAKADAKDASCCGGKDGKSCMGKDAKSCMKNESANASCTKGKCCDMKDGKGCCSHADGDKTAMGCCSGNQCSMDHAHAGMN